MIFACFPLIAATTGCEETRCQNHDGCFFLNPTACARQSHFRIELVHNVTSVFIAVNDQQPLADIQCTWDMLLLEKHYTNVTINRFQTADTDTNDSWMGYDQEIRPFALVFRSIHGDHIFNESDIRNDPSSLVLSSKFAIEFLSPASDGSVQLVIQCVTFKGVFWHALPVTYTSDTIGYVTSPFFDGTRRVYPSNYDGVFHLDIPENTSVLTSFQHFDIEAASYTVFDFVSFRTKNRKYSWMKTGVVAIPMRAFRSSIELRLHTDEMMRKAGFKMMFAILPRSQEPQLLSTNVLNCSVPYFALFQPLVHCNVMKECYSGEDEQHCSYQSDDCHEGDIDGGTKCYRLFRSRNITWSQAQYNCTQNGWTLPMPTMAEEFERFEQIFAVSRYVHFVFLGARLLPRLQEASLAVSAIYRGVWQWVDGRTAFVINVYGSVYDHMCAVYNAGGKVPIFPHKCYHKYEAEYFCQYDKPNRTNRNETVKPIQIPTLADSSVWNVSMLRCSSGHVTREFLSCSSAVQCRSEDSMMACKTKDSTLPLFVCQVSRTAFHYSLVCDFINHCHDGSDEDFCHHDVCPDTTLPCHNGQCIARSRFCDRKLDCYDGTDETQCDTGTIQDHILPEDNEDIHDGWLKRQESLPPVIYYIGAEGHLRLREMRHSENCPSTHFQCLGLYCFPVFFRCNGIADCPNLEDEASCDSYTCPGLYRCQNSRICLLTVHVCDGVFHCPYYDDEILCQTSCPKGCYCQGLAIVCTQRFPASSYTALRYLDASGTNMSLGDLSNNIYLIRLHLSRCHITFIPAVEFPNMIALDLSWNTLEFIDPQQFVMLPNLRVLILSGNPINRVVSRARGTKELTNLWKMDFSHTNLETYNGSSLRMFQNLKILNLSMSRLATITDAGFLSTKAIEFLDFRGSPLQSFPFDLLKELTFLKSLHTDNYILCCGDLLPAEFDPKNCKAKEDLLASCQDLLKSNTYRVFLWMLSSLTVVGNLGSFLGRLYLHSHSSNLGSFSVFVLCLSVADFFMGVYLAVVGVADLVFHGQYLRHSKEWKNSVSCSLAGFLSVSSSEVSAFIICLITLDRLLVLRFPFSTLHFDRSSALVGCVIVWMVGIFLAAVPLLPVASSWKFYSQTSMCLPLPFMTDFPGYTYSFSVMIALNFVLFLLIAAGQVVIYISVSSTSSISSARTTQSKDATIARRLTTVVVSDFLCWFPIGLLGVLGSTGTPIPEELNVAVAVFVLPINSALNPFLYTINVILERWAQHQQACLLQRLQSRAQAGGDKALVSVPPKDTRACALRQIRAWVKARVITREDLLLDSGQ